MLSTGNKYVCRGGADDLGVQGTNLLMQVLTNFLLRLVCFRELDPILLEMWGQHD